MKKVIFLSLLILFIGLVPVMAYAAEENHDRAEYQAILDKVNAECGTEIRFATPEELEKIGLKPDEIDISPAEFEILILKEVEVCKVANAEAIAKSSKYKGIQPDGSGSGVCKPGKMESARGSYSYYHSKPVTGANVHLEATVNNDYGAWRFSSVDSVWTSSTSSIPFPWFSATTYNYAYYDSYRTCAISLQGFTIDKYGAIVDSNASRSVDFWAGTNM